MPVRQNKLPLTNHASSGVLLGEYPGPVKIGGPFTTMVQKVLAEGESLTSIPDSSFETPLSLLHAILPHAAKEAAKTGESEPVCRERILRTFVFNNDKADFKNRDAIAAFAKAGEELNFEGLCRIADPDLFLSAVVYLLGFSPQTRSRLGYRDTANMPSMWVKRYRKSPDHFPVLRGIAKSV